MPLIDRRLFLASTLCAPLIGCSRTPGAAVPAQKVSAIPASLHVRDPNAGYFDLTKRRRILAETTDPVLIAARARLAKAPNCEKVLKLPVQDQKISLPTFYGDNDAWRAAVRPFWKAEDAASKLAGANLIADDRRYGDCLIDMLVKWADRDAMTRFHFSSDNKQAWFQIEATLFAFALALAAVRPDMKHRSGDVAKIDAWLLRAARLHFAIPGGKGGTCCNNHFYRRALYAAMIGVLTQDDDLFSVGMRAITSALESATPDGALPLEMERGKRAAHYQNYAVMYLVIIAEIIERQGYSAWGQNINGTSLHSLVDFNNRILASPKKVNSVAGTDAQLLTFHEDPQYFAWFEIYLSRFPNARMSRWISSRRPLYNRSMGGHLTAYFYTP